MVRSRHCTATNWFNLQKQILLVYLNATEFYKLFIITKWSFLITFRLDSCILQMCALKVDCWIFVALQMTDAVGWLGKRPVKCSGPGQQWHTASSGNAISRVENSNTSPVTEELIEVNSKHEACLDMILLTYFKRLMGKKKIQIERYYHDKFFFFKPRGNKCAVPSRRPAGAAKGTSICLPHVGMLRILTGFN